MNSSSVGSVRALADRGAVRIADRFASLVAARRRYRSGCPGANGRIQAKIVRKDGERRTRALVRHSRLDQCVDGQQVIVRDVLIRSALQIAARYEPASAVGDQVYGRLRPCR